MRTTMRCKNCLEEIVFEFRPRIGFEVWVHGHGKIFCLTKQGQTIGTLATPREVEDE